MKARLPAFVRSLADFVLQPTHRSFPSRNVTETRGSHPSDFRISSLSELRPRTPVGPDMFRIRSLLLPLSMAILVNWFIVTRGPAIREAMVPTVHKTSMLVDPVQ